VISTSNTSGGPIQYNPNINKIYGIGDSSFFFISPFNDSTGQSSLETELNDVSDSGSSNFISLSGSGQDTILFSTSEKIYIADLVSRTVEEYQKSPHFNFMVTTDENYIGYDFDAKEIHVIDKKTFQTKNIQKIPSNFSDTTTPFLAFDKSIDGLPLLITKNDNDNLYYLHVINPNDGSILETKSFDLQQLESPLSISYDSKRERVIFEADDSLTGSSIFSIDYNPFYS
jgi:hypothetical protein